MRHLPTAVLLAAFCAFVQQTSSFCLLTHSNLYVNSLRSGRAGRQCSFTKPQMPLLRAWRDAGRRGYDVVMTANDQSWVRPPPRGSKDIVFGGKVETLVPVQPKCDPGCDLPAYMQLPMDQYVLIPLPNKAKLERADNDHFKLLVPELQFFNVWVRPRLLARVQVTPQGVIIEASECKLEGSPEVFAHPTPQSQPDRLFECSLIIYQGTHRTRAFFFSGCVLRDRVRVLYMCAISAVGGGGRTLRLRGTCPSPRFEAEVAMHLTAASLQSSTSFLSLPPVFSTCFPPASFPTAPHKYPIPSSAR